jgi:protein-disulfide isomerase
MSTPEPSKKERRDAARAARQQAEQAEASQAQRLRRLRMLGAVVVAAAVVVVIAIAASGGSSNNSHAPKAGEAVSGRSDVAAMLNGIQQSGITLGNPKAKVTLIEFADLQCPVCQQYSLQVLPQIVQNYVRTGKVKMDLRLVTILDRNGPGDSQRMAQLAYGAQQQNRLWNFADTVYFNQGTEETGYATDAYLRKIAGSVPGLNVAAAFAARATPAATAQIGAATSLFSRYGATGTPTIVVGKTGGSLKTLSGFDQQTVSSAIDAALK